MIGKLESDLTGRDYDELANNSAGPQLIALRDGGIGTVERMRDSLVEALCTATDEALTQTAARWSQIEEFEGTADPEDLFMFLIEFSALARQARSSNSSLYCWCCV